MIKPDNYAAVESDVREALLKSFQALEGKSIHEFTPVPAR
jgi:hypothetical protein